MTDTEQKQQPATKTATAKPLNMRKALAGVNLLSGMSQKQALLQAGYSPATAHNPGSNNLGVKHCVAEAKQLVPTADPATLIAAARRAFNDKLTAATASKAALDKVRLGEIARAVDVAEKWYSPSVGDGEISPRDWVDRTTWVAEALELLKQRQRKPLDDVVAAEERK